MRYLFAIICSVLLSVGSANADVCITFYEGLRIDPSILGYIFKEEIADALYNTD